MAGSFQNVRMVIGDPNRDLRVSLNSQLGQMGFPSVPHTDDLVSIKSMVEKNAVDLMVSDTSLPGVSFYDLVRGIRHAEVGDNPFVVIVALINNPDLEKVQKAIACGVDEILTKPVSSGKVMDRILKLTNRRKPFVVTSDYIGPNRRNEVREGTQDVPKIDAPNPLKFLTQGGSLADYMNAVNSTQSEINNRCIERYAFQVSYLVDQLMPKYVDGRATQDSVQSDLGKLSETVSDIKGRLEGSRYSHVSALCQSMNDVVARMLKSPLEPNRRDLELMPEVSRAITLAFDADAEDAAIARDISESVKRV